MIFYTAGRETTFPLQSILDSRRLSSPQIKTLSELIKRYEWPNLACILDIPILAIRTFDNFGYAIIGLFLYNKSRHFSRKKVVECCKEFFSFKKISEILR